MLRAGCLSVVFSDSDVIDQLFEVCSDWLTPTNQVHWVRRTQLQRMPLVPESLVVDPVQLSRIVFYYGGNGARRAAEIASDVTGRKRMDCVVCEFPSVPHNSSLGALLAIFKGFCRGGRSVAVVLPKQEDLMMVSSLYTAHLYEWTAEGKLLPLVE